MNLVIKNQNYKIIDSLNIEIIKTLQGEFSLDEVQAQLVNFIYNKAVVDITAIRNFYDINSVINFFRGFDSSKLIILLNDSEVINSNAYLGRLVESGYYNFTRNAAGINYLLDNPNSYEQVRQFTVNMTSNSYFDPLSNQNQMSNQFQSPSQGSFNNPYQSTQQMTIEGKDYKVNKDQVILGIQNLTEHAGSTTLAYMMLKQLRLNYKVKAIEMNKQDFIYFRDSDLSLCTSIDDLKMKLKEYATLDIIIIDLNDFDASSLCDELIYLVDPGTLKLNKLIKKDSNCYLKTQNGKVVLNRSSIKSEELTNFEYETKFKVFFNLTNFDDRKERIQIIDELLYKLGFKKQNPNSGGLFGSIFNKNQ